MSDHLINLLEMKIASNELDPFIKSLLVNQSPVIENIDNDENNSSVTFIYQGDSNCRIANIYSPLIGGFPQQMTRLKETNYFYYCMSVPNNIRVSYAFLPNMLFTDVDAADRDKSLKLFCEMWPKLISDPYNANIQTLKNGESRATINVSILEMPLAPSIIWSQKENLTQSGTVNKHTITSKYINNNRDYWVYLPASYDENISYPVILVFDGQLYYESGISLPTILDNLIENKKIPPLIAVLIDSVGFYTRRVDLNCSDMFLKFITDELIPEIDLEYSISSDRIDKILMGASLGASFSLYSALQRPDLFGKVLGQSGGDNVIAELITPGRGNKLKVYLDIGSMENPAMIQEIRDRLLSAGHEVIYDEFPGSHDLVCWETSIPNALIKLLDGNNHQ